MSESPERVPWSVVRRLEFVEFRLVWEGRVNRSDLVEAFDISAQQASADLGRYMETAPGNVAYDKNLKTFVPGPTFSPRFLRKHADRYLLQMAAIENGWIEREDTWFRGLPPVGVAPAPSRRVDAHVVQQLLGAIRSGQEVEVSYQSMSQPDRVRRVIAPHALGYDGVRWHARAWCRQHNDFRDFVLTRLLDVGVPGPTEADASLDFEWHDVVEVLLAPNPKLSPSKRLAIEKEYEMVDGRLTVPTRVALAYYMVRSLFLDLPEDLDIAPERRQLVLVNGPEIDAARARAREATAKALGAVVERRSA